MELIRAAYEGDTSGVLRMAMGRAPRQSQVTLIGCWVEAESRYVGMMDYSPVTDEWRYIPVESMAGRWLTAVQWQAVERLPEGKLTSADRA